MSFSTGQLIVSNSVPREFQGIAAGIVSLITNYSYVTIQLFEEQRLIPG